eukprot:7654139-Karenia_brevis.AAC.1
MFKLWTNAGIKHASQWPSRQVTDEQVVALIRGMITGSERNAWLMLRNVLKKSVKLANPMDVASRHHGGALAPTSPNMNLGAEHI